MREILFRIKHPAGEWWYGLPTKITDKFASFQSVGGWYCAINKIDTLSQFTGLLDKNGNKVFDGDIFENIAGYRYLVFFENGCFIARLICDMPDEYITKLKFCDISHLISRGCEVIGNKWDNPELIIPK